MAISKVAIASILLSLVLLFQIAHAAEEQRYSGYVPGAKMDCGAACAARCRLSGRPKLCHRACGTCCARCNCVPPGTSGNQEMCACYYTMTTHGGRRKCP